MGGTQCNSTDWQPRIRGIRKNATLVSQEQVLGSAVRSWWWRETRREGGRDCESCWGFWWEVGRGKGSPCLKIRPSNPWRIRRRQEDQEVFQRSLSHPSPPGLTPCRHLQTYLPLWTSFASQRLPPGRDWCRKWRSQWSLTGPCLWKSWPCQKFEGNQDWRGRGSWRQMGWPSRGGEPAAASAWQTSTPGQADSVWLNKKFDGKVGWNCLHVNITTTPRRQSLATFTNMSKITFAITSDCSPALEWALISESTNCQMWYCSHKIALFVSLLSLSK